VTDLFKMFKQNLVKNKDATQKRKQKWVQIIITSNETTEQTELRKTLKEHRVIL